MASPTRKTERKYPRSVTLDNKTPVTIRPMTAADADRIVAFARALPEEDLLFLRADITDPKVVAQWVDNLGAGRTVSVLAEANGDLAGYASLHYNSVAWQRHLGEILDALDIAHAEIKKLCATMQELADKAGKDKVEVEAPEHVVHALLDRARLGNLGRGLALLLAFLFVGLFVLQSLQHIFPLEPALFAANPFFEPVELRDHFDHLIARFGDAVSIAWVNEKFGRDAQFLQGHVQFFALGAWDARVAVDHVD